jgi:hypothetical protein
VSSDAQDRVVKQLEDRYDRMACEPQDDGSLKVTARHFGVGLTVWERVLRIARDGTILSDTDDYDIDNYEEFG